jgi:hypothetical protein
LISLRLNHRAGSYDPSMATALARKRATVSDLTAALAESWSRDTSADPTGWSDENRAWGQCAVTALIVQDYVEGSLLRGEVGPISHYWNVLPNGEHVDLTWVQFEPTAGIENIEPRAREYVLSHPETHRRYQLLTRRVQQALLRSG